MKTREKNKAEKLDDSNRLLQAEKAFQSSAIEFTNEFIDSEGNVLYATWQSAVDKKWEIERIKEIAAMAKVGDEWDYSNGITGAYRYRNA
jgi:tRNA A37 N6-isopentenylltransferase MiaA